MVQEGSQQHTTLLSKKQNLDEKKHQMSYDDTTKV